MNHEAKFSYRVIGSQLWDPEQDNVDVEVELEGGQRYGATFFTLENLRHLFAKNKSTGECASGRYFWATNMIIVRQLLAADIERAISDLIKNGEFDTAFALLDP